MSFRLHPLLTGLLALLAAAFLTFAPLAGFAAQDDWSRVSYPIEVLELKAQRVNLTNTARAPPHAGANVMATGTVLAQSGDLRALDGAKTTVAVYALLRSSNAPNRTADDVFETGANITPNSTLDRYSHIGADGTFVTEVSSIENVIGRIPSNATEIRITRQQAAQLETDLGLNPGSLEANNTLSLVDDIAGRCPRCPIGGNDQFLGGGQGLPGGGSELVIDSIPSSGGNGVRQIMVIVE